MLQTAICNYEINHTGTVELMYVKIALLKLFFIFATEMLKKWIIFNLIKFELEICIQLLQCRFFNKKSSKGFKWIFLIFDDNKY